MLVKPVGHIKQDTLVYDETDMNPIEVGVQMLEQTEPTDRQVDLLIGAA